MQGTQLATGVRNHIAPGIQSGSGDPIADKMGPLADCMLECVDVNKQFDDVAVLRGFNLQVQQGQVVALLGPSGCGKTTALRSIAGFAQPDSGAIRIAGETMHEERRSVPPEKRRVGMVFQEGALFPHLTVEQNIAYGLSRNDNKPERVDDVVRMTGLDGLVQRMPYELSGGQQQRVALARALAPRPELLLLDEPFSNLDPGLREQVRRDVVDILRAGGVTAVFVTHDQEEAMYVGDTIAVMNQGRIEQQGTPQDVFHRPRSKFVAEFIGMVDFVPARWEKGRILSDIGDADWPDCPDNTEGNPGNVGDFKHTGSLEIMVRPDCVECEPAENGNGVIVEREFRGAFYLYRIALNSGGSVRCLLSHTDEYEVGARVMVRVRCGHSMRPFINGAALAD